LIIFFWHSFMHSIWYMFWDSLGQSFWHRFWHSMFGSRRGPLHPELTISRSDPGVHHCIGSSRSSVRVPAWPPLHLALVIYRVRHRAGKEELLQSIETLTWQVGNYPVFRKL
jgi:hypothetical protein